MITVNSVVERREAVTAINDYDGRTGGLKSQSAKYEKPLWYFLSSIIPGRDFPHGYTVRAMQSELLKHNLSYSQVAVNRCLSIMMNLDRSIHPHRRNCGIGCYDLVSRLGGLHTRWSYPFYYFFGVSEEEVKYHRKANNIVL